ncbi:pyridoxamine 5'-phosphate oxidase family protein [Paucibacter soli]|uniref:pyridoxamine 5'-phosphate oxidase family protein n=1 Tax=Paucibacter soli TaxID=3133433 RepID=UPI0030AA9159
MTGADPFHAGEQALQARLGVRERMAQVGAKVVRSYMPEQHRELFGKLPTLLLAALDSAGQPWASMVAGAPGFVSSPHERELALALGAAPDDPVLALLAPGAPVGVLGLEPHTRRRNRMNGRVLAHAEGRLRIEVLQSFGNCPKYIQARQPLPRPPGPAPASQTLGPGLDDAALALIARSDTAFIASASARARSPDGSEGLDVSHRGGPPGFLRQRWQHGQLWLDLADYPGNLFFNTLGNLSVHPQAGLLLLDYRDGGLLHLRVRAEIDGQDLRLAVQGGLWRPAVLPWRWSEAEPAPQFRP